MCIIYHTKQVFHLLEEGLIIIIVIVVFNIKTGILISILKLRMNKTLLFVAALSVTLLSTVASQCIIFKVLHY